MAARGGGAKSGGALPNLRSFGPKRAIFCPKQPQNPGETPKRRDTVSTLHVRLDFTVSKSSLVPFNSMICPRNGPKMRQKAPKSAQCAPTPRNQAGAVSWALWLKIRFRGHLVHPQSPTFCGFQASQSPNETRRPSNQWSLGAAGGQPGPRMAGANGGDGENWLAPGGGHGCRLKEGGGGFGKGTSVTGPMYGPHCQPFFFLVCYTLSDF